MKKGFYFIGVHETDKDGNGCFVPRLEEGSIEEYGRLFIHRDKDYQNFPYKWRLSHTGSGAVVIADLDLKSARLLVKKLQPFKLWDIEKFEDIQKACRDMDNPEVVEIMELRHLRAE
jgi:hypothetical protein